MTGFRPFVFSKSLRSIVIMLAAVGGLAACTQAPTPPAPWGEIRLLAQAEQTAPPALAMTEDGLVAAWVGSDARGVHHDARVLTSGLLSDVQALPLPPSQPRDQHLVPGSSGWLHLLWMDLNEGGEMRLYTALLSVPGLRVQRGPTPASERMTLRFAALANADGGVLTAWSGGNLAEPMVTLRRIDSEGRPTQRLGTLPGADYPVLLRGEDSVFVIWKGVFDDAIYRADLSGDIVGSSTRLTSSPSLGRGDRLASLEAGRDETHDYLFWNITRMGGVCETWYAAGVGSSAWSQPQLLVLSAPGTEPVETGYNSGEVRRIGPGALDLCLGAPLSETGQTLPLAAQASAGLAIVYFQAGQPVGEQLVSPGSGVLAPPVLLSDRNRDLYLGWSEPTGAGYAELKLVSTR